MKIAITGHTRGLGLAFYNHFKYSNDVIGLSRSTGHDINQPDTLVPIIESCDLFINNAYCEQQQSKLIELTTVPIISCGSMGADFARSGNPYYINKRHLEDTHKRIRRTTDRLMLLLKMGYLQNYADKSPIMYSEILSAVDWWLVSPRVTMIEFENHCLIYGA